MEFYNIINDTILESKKYNYGTMILEKDIYGKELRKYLTVDYRDGEDNLSLYENLISYKTIYISSIGDFKYKPSLTSNLMNMQVDELIVSADLLEPAIIDKEELVIIMDSNSFLENMAMIDSRFKPFKRVILYTDTTFKWDNIIYDWKSRTERLTLIVEERQSYISNGEEPYYDISSALPVKALKDNFADLEIIFLKDEEIHTEKLKDSNFREIYADIFQEEYLYSKDLEKRLIKDIDWVELVYNHYRYSPNLYEIDLHSKWIVSKYNQYHPFKDDRPVVLYMNKEDFKYSIDGKNFLEINPILLPLIESFREYRQTYKDIEGGK